MANVRVEAMRDGFTKYHLDGKAVLHHLTATEHLYHDHPWSFTSHVLTGGYVEELRDGTRITRLPGTSHSVPASHTHRIVELPAGECWTLVFAGLPEQEVTFYDPR